jgi:hypothetical protein
VECSRARACLERVGAGEGGERIEPPGAGRGGEAAALTAWRKWLRNNALDSVMIGGMADVLPADDRIERYTGELIAYVRSLFPMRFYTARSGGCSTPRRRC